jgi:transcriptional regulator with XRE-family HTH domain
LSLGEYLTRKLAEKRLSAAEVARRSKGAFVESYVLKIMHEEIKHPTIPRLKALAQALGVDEDEILAEAGVEGRQVWPPNKLLSVMQKVVASPELTELINLAVDKKPEELRKVLKMLKK